MRTVRYTAVQSYRVQRLVLAGDIKTARLSESFVCDGLCQNVASGNSPVTLACVTLLPYHVGSLCNCITVSAFRERYGKTHPGSAWGAFVFIGICGLFAPRIGGFQPYRGA